MIFVLTIEEFFRKHIAVIVISFGVPMGAKIWLEDTKCPFPMFLDHDRALYESFGLQRSIEKVRFSIIDYFCLCLFYYDYSIKIQF